MTLHVGHKLDPKRDLVCDDAMRPLQEAPADPARPRRRKAFYVTFPGGYIGAFSSPAGPMLFVNGEQYAFRDPSWSVRVEMKGDARRAVFDGLRTSPLILSIHVFTSTRGMPTCASTNRSRCAVILPSI